MALREEEPRREVRVIDARINVIPPPASQVRIVLRRLDGEAPPPTRRVRVKFLKGGS